jgi:hypothetical protein
MSNADKTVFISYRRSLSRHWARNIFDYLRGRDYNVFFDIKTIDSGEFDKIILNQIAARMHFILLLTKGSLERCQYEGDWVRREIEEALRLGRNIVPIVDVDERTDFLAEVGYLPKATADELAKFNALQYLDYYGETVLETLCSRFLKMPD